MYSQQGDGSGQNEFACSGRPLSEMFHDMSDSEESEEDSDAEFLVHPILRSLIKSKSAYTVSRNPPRLKASKTVFEINISKMWESTADEEAPVANFTPDLDSKWPEPDSPSPRLTQRSSSSRKSSCWSSPPNIYVEQSLSPSSIGLASECWSAPECLGCDSEEEESAAEVPQRAWSCCEIDIGNGESSAFSGAYPVIDSSKPVPSLSSVHLPSSNDTSPVPPSPPRPLSPVLGKAAVRTSRISGSVSMQLRPRPESSTLIDTSASDDDLPQQDPWPQQEVWPEEDIMQRSLRRGWTANDTVVSSVPRSQSPQMSASFDCNPPPENHRSDLSESRCTDAQLRFVPDELKGSSRSQLDEIERRDLITRSAWIDRGSTIHLQDKIEGQRSTAGSDRCESQSSFRVEPSVASEHMRRSYTTEELKKERRRLPKRPDVEPFPNDMPSSISLHGHSLCPDVRSSREDASVRNGDVLYFPTPAPPRDLGPLPVVGETCHRTTADDYEPPTPVTLNPSPLLTGRRLPLLPVSLRYQTMSLPHQTVQKPQESHTLCFIDGMTDSVMGRSAFEDSYYEEDGINGNQHIKPRKSFFSPDDSSGVSSCTTSDSLNPTHRAQSAFFPRHSDEVLLDIGDAIHVDRTCEDHWCYGTNLRTGMSGIFPSAIVCEIDIVEEICMGALPSNANKVTESERDTFYLTMLASIEVGHHKGNDVLVQAMNKVLSMYKNHEEIIVPQTVLMEVSFRGIHVIDKRRKNFFQCPTFDFFYSLQNISFCGAHPKQLKYFGFITKHPLLPRFACHVFLSSQSTQPIVESIGRAFKRSYDEYMAFAHPTEDIYLE
ncbi:hypothetical protein RB195_019476 [Necator americanus]|uniref:Phosphotyrosine interaction domain protein n=2 Tax=Necator americanus TaxID=51031 RepID=A0ABR1CF94_NECAM